MQTIHSIEFQLRLPEEPTCKSPRLQAATAPARAQIVMCFIHLLQLTATIWYIFVLSPTIVETPLSAQHDDDVRLFHVKR